MKSIYYFSLLSIVIASCTISNNKIAQEKYCGYEMTYNEVMEISAWYAKNPNAYDLKNGSEIYSEINDSIRYNMPDTAVYELFLMKLTDEEVVMDAYVPNNKQFIEDVACAFMQSNFSSIVPLHRKIRIFIYTNEDGSGDSPLAIAIKNK